MNANRTNNLTPEQQAMLPAVPWPLQPMIDDLCHRVEKCRLLVREAIIARVMEEYPEGNSERQDELQRIANGQFSTR